MTSLLLALQLFAASADGQSYPVTGGPLLHAASKAAASGVVYLGLRELGLSKPAAGLLASVGLLVAAKGVELAKGHTLGPLDTLHDLSWHLLPVASLALSGRWRLTAAWALSMTAVGTCRRASPRWC